MNLLRTSIWFRTHFRYIRGFTLVELLVSISIVAVIMTVVLTRYQSFDSTVLLNSLAYNIALSLREAQVLGVSVRADAASFSVAYGMHFDIDSPTTYALFTDQNANSQYDLGEEVSSYTIGQDNSILDLCANATCDLTTLDIMFLRPEPDAFFYSVPSVSGIGSAEVVVGSPNGQERRVSAWATGQISVE